MAFKDDLRGSLVIELAEPLEEAIFEGHGDGIPSTNVVDFTTERLLRKPDSMSCEEVTPAALLKLAEAEMPANAVKCYLTIITQEPEGGFGVINYRSNLSRTEEIAYRQLGVQEALENWRENG